MKLLQWNVWYKEDIENILLQIQEINPDVICLQELTIGFDDQKVKNTIEFLSEKLGFNNYYKEMKPGTDNWSIANSILTRYPIKSSYFNWINQPTGSGGYDDEYRCYIQVTLDIEDKEFTVATTHMSYTDRFIETDRKLMESESLIRNFKNRKRFIFTGDLNVTPDSKVIKNISKYLTHSGPDLKQPTWTTKPFEYNGFSAVTLDWRLDYVFSSKDVTILDTEIIQTNYSDHLPILVNIKV